MVSYQEFSDYPDVSVCENDLRYCTVPVHRNARQQAPEFYPDINIGQELYRGLVETSKDTRRTLIVPVNERLIKRIIRTYFEEGLIEALKEAKNPQNVSRNLVISKIASYALKTIEIAKNVKIFFMPHLKEQGIESIEKYSETRGWKKSSIRFIKWHPNCFKIAVAALDDSIRIYDDKNSTIPVLKSWSQKCITSLAWRPYSSSELAVGCEAGVILWSIDPCLQTTRPPTQVNRLSSENHNNVICVEWSPNGNLLATSSVNDPSVLIWDVDQSRSLPLKRSMPPCSFLRWSPDSSHLFSATVGNVFRVWETERWTHERWTIASGNVQSAAWSPCGACLLFVNSDESILYRLQFTEEELLVSTSLPKHALPIADLGKVIVADQEVGGMPQSIAWDSHGYFLAVTFKDSPCIAVFTTTITKHNFNISPTSFIEGDGDEYPSFITFQNEYKKNSNSVLTIGWSSGRVEFLPVVNI